MPQVPQLWTSISLCQLYHQETLHKANFLVYSIYGINGCPKSAGNKTVDDKGNPLWRMGPSPKGPYWDEGMKLGYQDAGSWTLFKSTPVDRRKAAWFVRSVYCIKTVDLKKSDVGLTIIRDSTINHKHFTQRAPKLGGLVEILQI